MAIFVSPSDKAIFEGKYLLVDNDFLSELSKNKELLKETLNLFSNEKILIDPLVEFEFLRDLYIPALRDNNKKFISSNLFGLVPNHQEIFKKLLENAMLLSEIYAHQNSQNQNHKSSFVDLFLAARLMLWSDSMLLITGNQKDFPAVIFETVGVISLDRVADGSSKTYSYLKFSKDKFDDCNQKLSKVR